MSCWCDKTRGIVLSYLCRPAVPVKSVVPPRVAFNHPYLPPYQLPGVGAHSGSVQSLVNPDQQIKDGETFGIQVLKYAIEGTAR